MDFPYFPSAMPGSRSSVFGSGDETSPKFMFITPMLMNWVDIGVRYVSLVQKVAGDRHRMFRIHIGHSRCCVGPYTVPKGFYPYVVLRS